MLLGVTEARAKAGSIQASPDMVNDPQALAKFQAAQAQLSGALSRLLVVSERYPRAQVGPELPRSAGAARGHGESHHRGAQPLHPGRAGLQLDGADLPGQSDCLDVRLQDQAEFHRRERGCDIQATCRGFFRAGRVRAFRADTRSGQPRRRSRLALSLAREALERGRVGAACAWAAAAVLCLAAPLALAQVPVPPLTARVVDLTGMLSGGAVNRIESELAALEARKGSQIAVLIVPTTQSRGDRAIRHPRGRSVEARPQGCRRRRDTARRQGRSARAHRGRIRSRGGVARCGGEPHHRRDHRAAFQAGRLRRGRRGRCRSR